MGSSLKPRPNRPVKIAGTDKEKFDGVVDNVRNLWDITNKLTTDLDNVLKYLNDNISLPQVEKLIRKYSVHNNLLELQGGSPYYHSNQSINTTDSPSFAGGKFGTVSNYSQFEADGTLVFNGNATVWEDQNFDSAITAVGANAPNLINWDTTSIKIAAFPHNLLKELNFVKEYSHSGKVGVTIKPHAHIFPTTASPTGTVKFFLEYYIKNDGLTPTTGTSSATYDFTGKIQWNEYRIEFPDITSSVLGPGTQIGMRLYRTNSDAGTYANQVAVSTWGYHFENDTGGSRSPTTK